MELDLEVAVDRPPEAVFAYVSHLGDWPEWRAALASSEPVAGTPAPALEPGARWHLQLHALGRDVEMTVEVIALEPDARLDIRTVEGPLRGVNSFVVTPSGQGALLRVLGAVELEGPLRLAAALIAPQLREAWHADLQALRSRLEAAGGP